MPSLIVSVAFLDDNDDLNHDMWQANNQEQLTNIIVQLNQTDIFTWMDFDNIKGDMLKLSSEFESLFRNKEKSVKCLYVE